MSPASATPAHRLDPSGPAGEEARYWHHPSLPEVELLRATFVSHTFTRHTHETYTVGVIESGVEEYTYRGETHRAGRGGIVIVEPHEVHTGHAGTPEGWSYRMLYPSVATVTAVTAELGLAAPPAFAGSSLDDPACADRLRAAHLAAERGDRLSASSLTHAALVELVRRHARQGTRLRGPGTSPRAVALARDALQENLVDPPSLDELANLAESTPFALLRAFRATHGLPPHAYLNQLRVQRARRLLATGAAPSAVAFQVGFADQPHLTRHFKRYVGVAPGAYQRGLNAGPPRSGTQ
ncbi:AraC family transcriptional regulator [Salinactinospora qingdaonensis]|uniref:AraC family transcriptional regulator n=1 Tax=Salinactinospora qingdaonensis TaxID=702744 RepID=A0ABP7FLY6_9ACTN